MAKVRNKSFFGSAGLLLRQEKQLMAWKFAFKCSILINLMSETFAYIDQEAVFDWELEHVAEVAVTGPEGGQGHLAGSTSHLFNMAMCLNNIQVTFIYHGMSCGMDLCLFKLNKKMDELFLILIYLFSLHKINKLCKIKVIFRKNVTIYNFENFK